MGRWLHLWKDVHVMAVDDLPWWTKEEPGGGFGELVVDTGSGPSLLHAEMVDKRSIFVRVGPVCIWAYVGRSGKVYVTHIEDDRERVSIAEV